MSFLESIYKKVKHFFSQAPVIETRESWLCVFLKRGQDYLFLQNSGIGLPNCKPIMLPLDSSLSIEKGFSDIQDYLFKELEIDPTNIEVGYDVMSLYPVINKIYYFAFVDISDFDYKEITEKNAEHNLISVDYPQIIEFEDQNIFFKYLLKNM